MVNDYSNARFKLVLYRNHLFLYMKQLLACFLLLMFPLMAWCQTDHFLYLQTDYKQPFYVRYNNKIHSSSENGHLILGNLQEDTTIQFIVGFPKNAHEEQQFKLTIKNDFGFLLKNFGEEGWGLFNLQTLELIKNNNQPPPEKKATQQTTAGGVKKTDAFSIMLANAVNDTAILYAAASIPDPVPEPVDAIVKNQPEIKDEKKNGADSSAIAAITENNKEVKQPAIVKIIPAPVPEIIKKDTNPVIRETEPVRVTEPVKDIVKENNNIPAKEPVAEEKKKDSAPAIVKTPVKEEVHSLPTTINKAAELLTDNAYIAVFVDSLTNDYDTIRISIPFDESGMLRKNAFQKNKESNPVIKSQDPIVKSEPVTITPKEEKPIAKTSEPITRINTTPKKVKEQNPVVKPKDTTVKSAPAVVTPKEDKPAAKVTEPITRINTNPKKPTEQKPVVKAKEEKPVTKPIDPIDTDITSDPVVGKPTQEKPVIKTEEPIVKTEPPPVPVKTEPPPVEVKKETPVVTVTADSAKTTAPARKKVFMFNSDCKVYASENDVDKLRVKMLTQPSDDGKLTIAKKILKQRCFTTRHIKALSELFSTDEGKYRWLDLAYLFVSDPSNYQMAGDLLKDEYFINRFKAMIRHAP